MYTLPSFPFFKPIELADRSFISEKLLACRPEISELTFTNLFIWRDHYEFRWSVYEDWLCVTGRDERGIIFAMEPTGPSPRAGAVLSILEWLKEEQKEPFPRIERAGGSLASELAHMSQLSIEPAREHFDYVYLTEDLIGLSGSKYRTKRNHINRFSRSYSSYRYETLEAHHLDACWSLQEEWCTLHRCEEDLNLLGEWEAVKNILSHYGTLGAAGAVILINESVKAFTIGELMNENTAVIHIEKADPGIPGLYQIINREFCARQWRHVKFINREQDLGVQGLRDAKRSYCPHHLVKKYRITLRPT